MGTKIINRTCLVSDPLTDLNIADAVDEVADLVCLREVQLDSEGQRKELLSILNQIS